MKHPLHVVMLIDAWFPFYGGGQVHVANLARTLQKNHPITIKIFYPTSTNSISRAIWTILVIPQVWFYSLSHKIDLFHSHGFSPGLSAKILSILLSKPAVHTVHGSHLMDQNSQSLKAALELFLLTKIRYHAQITVSSSFLEYQNINQPIIIRNAVNLKDFDSVTVAKQNRPTIIFVGRDHPDKGINTLKQAFTQVQKTFPQAHLTIVSGGRLHGKPLIREYKKSHIFVLPSLAEGQPITLLEAWAAKLPVIVTPVGDNPNMVNNQNGRLFPVADSNKLTSHLLELLKNKTTAKKLGENGYQLVKANHTWDTVATKTYQVYKNLLK